MKKYIVRANVYSFQNCVDSLSYYQFKSYSDFLKRIDQYEKRGFKVKKHYSNKVSFDKNYLGGNHNG